MAPKSKTIQSQEPIEDCDEIYESSPLVHKEKVTRRHHPYAFKPRTGHASSSREEILDDEDENMYLTHSEPRGTISRHMSRALSQIGRNQARKAHNVEKHASQKKQQRWVKVPLLENVHGMRSAVHPHCLVLLKVRDKDFSSLPPPPSTEECEIVIQVAGHVGYVHNDVFNEP
ncbi:hypothetical protein O181_021981 [Austropuccinia psidii MF-1]|uniref:Uncharacterized protein n=1 Tax=Austropuccinia psidii MF-1 TaxID=1389203 RepID=A0A9Q3CC00_9BASI|nr:hypothetical protein [Austropuccinia psidii MF-1]